jgi:hypothetical protein
MNARQQKIFRDRLKWAARGVLKTIDTDAYTAYVLHVDTLIEAAKQQSKLSLLDANGRPSALLRLQRQTAEVIVALATQLGFTPVARTRLGTSTPPVEEADRFETLRRVA